MKIGILSMQQIVNYGSFLQAYALKSILKTLGHDVRFINIKPGEQIPKYRLSKLHKVKLMFKRLWVKKPIKQIYYTLNLHKRFNKEFFSELGVPKEIDICMYDSIVIGSDEVFNFAQKTNFGFSTQLFGEGLNAKKIISYAGCFGTTTLDIINELRLKETLITLLKNFSTISVRDNNSHNIIQSLTGISPQIHLDPVLIYDFTNEEAPIDLNRLPYILIYSYPGRMNNNNEISVIKNYAKNKGYRIISIANYFDWVDEVITPHPFEVLSYFKGAACVVTDTFHGTVMAIKYNKQFATIIRDSNKQKLSDLLSRFDLNQQEVIDVSFVPFILERPIDYMPVNDKIRQEQNRTLDYLKTEL